MKLTCVFAKLFLLFKILYDLVYSLHVSYNIKYINFCVDDKYVFVRIIETSLDQCVIECVRRPGCLALNFRRRLTLCNLLDTDTLSELESSVKNYMYDCDLVIKSDIHYKLPTGCKDCKIGENCNFDNGMCTITECPKQTKVDNGVLFGNMNNIGNRLKFTCNKGYKTETGEMYSTCQANGTWSVTPKCVKECPDGWYSFGGSSYCFLDIEKSFQEAKSECNQYEAHLVHIDDESENTFIHERLRDVGDRRWIGLLDISTSTTIFYRKWIWTDTDMTATFFHWASFEPDNNKMNERCVIVKNAGWADVNCPRSFKPICEKTITH